MPLYLHAPLFKCPKSPIYLHRGPHPNAKRALLNAKEPYKIENEPQLNAKETSHHTLKGAHSLMQSSAMVKEPCMPAKETPQSAKRDKLTHAELGHAPSASTSLEEPQRTQSNCERCLETREKRPTDTYESTRLSLVSKIPQRDPFSFRCGSGAGCRCGWQFGIRI